MGPKAKYYTVTMFGKGTHVFQDARPKLRASGSFAEWHPPGSDTTEE